MEYAKTRAQARAAGDTHYFTGKPCPSNHTCLRYTSNGGCLECLKVKEYDTDADGIEKPRPCRKGHGLYTGRQCPECQKQWKLEHPLNEEQMQDKRDRQAQRTEACREYSRNLRETTPCTDCGLLFPWFIMEYDHIKGRQGGPTVAGLVGQGNMKILLAEIAKCEIVCRNCHAIRTHFRAVEEGKRRP